MVSYGRGLTRGLALEVVKSCAIMVMLNECLYNNESLSDGCPASGDLTRLNPNEYR